LADLDAQRIVCQEDLDEAATIVWARARLADCSPDTFLAVMSLQYSNLLAYEHILRRRTQPEKG
jgi:hypothetical protein